MQILSIVHYATLFLFGIFSSAYFLGIRFHRKALLSLLLFALCSGAGHLLAYLFLGESMTEKLYPLIVHLPLILFLGSRFRCRFSAAMLSVFTAYLCCQVSNWIGLAVQLVTDVPWVHYAVRITVTVLFFVILIRLPSAILSRLLQKSTGDILLLALVPTAYYLFDYTTSVYTDLLYSGNPVVAEFLGFTLSAAYILFLLQYLKQYEEKCDAQQRNQLMQMQQIHIEKELEAIRHAEQTVTILRHDMRHFLANISSFIQAGDTETAQNYIREVTEAVDRTVTQRYTSNEIVNTILSFHADIMAKNGIAFHPNVQVPKHLSLSDVDITSVLSNSLENAILAVLPLSEEQRLVELTMRMHQGQLLLSVKNTFAERPVFVDGIPQPKTEGHGIGTRSIRYVVEKLNGNYHFAVRDNKCVLQIILCVNEESE